MQCGHTQPSHRAHPAAAFPTSRPSHSLPHVWLRHTCAFPKIPGAMARSCGRAAPGTFYLPHGTAGELLTPPPWSSFAPPREPGFPPWGARQGCPFLPALGVSLGLRAGSSRLRRGSCGRRGHRTAHNGSGGTMVPCARVLSHQPCVRLLPPQKTAGRRPGESRRPPCSQDSGWTLDGVVREGSHGAAQGSGKRPRRGLGGLQLCECWAQGPSVWSPPQALVFDTVL